MYRCGKEEIEAVTATIEAGGLFKVNGKLQNCQNLEQEFCEKFNAKHAIYMTSGHAALVTALTALGVGPGDQVIVPAYTYISTALAVVSVGAIPVVADINETMTIDPASIEAKITKSTKAIVPVHIQGFPCNMDAIMALAKKYNLFVVEDACQADGGKFGGKRLGTIGDAGALSFNYYKIISAGEGGLLLTNNREVFERALIYQDSAAIAYFGNQMEGFTTEQFCGNEYRASEILAAFTRVQLTRLDGILEDMGNNKKYMASLLAPHFTLAPSNDIDGDCGNCLPIQFPTIEEAVAFCASTKANTSCECGRPIGTGKHVYKNWTAIMNKKGAYNPLMDPFKFEANKDIIPEYTEDMCAKSLDILSRTCYVDINPDMTKEQIEARAKELIAALAAK